MQWKRRIGWIVGGIAIFLVVVAVAGYLYLRSTSFQNFALRTIAREAESATGGKTKIGHLDFSLSTLTAHLYDITIRGTESADQPPLLHADKLTVGIKVISAWKRQVNLSELTIDRPVIHLEVNGEGKNNLPTAPPSQSSSHTSVFDLGVRHAQIKNGEIDYNDRKTPMDADLYDLGTEIHFIPGTKTYEGSLSYKDGKLRYAQYAALPHAFQANFSASPEKFLLQSATIQVASSQVRLHAELTNYSNPTATGNFQIQLHTQDFAGFSPTTNPKGDLLLAGVLNYQSKPQEPALRALSLDGHIMSDELAAAASGKRVELRRLEGTYQLAGARLRVNKLRAETLGGGLATDVDISDIDTTPSAQVRASLQNISLQAVQAALGQRGTPTATISGRLNGTAEVAWKGSVNNLRAKSDLSVQAVASNHTSPGSNEVPVNGVVHATYDGARQTIVLRDTSVRLPSATITANGQISDTSNLVVQLAANDLHQLATLASSFRTTQGPPPAISGAASLNAVVHGSMKKPNITGQLNAQDLQVEGSQWSKVQAQLQADATHFAMEKGLLLNAHQGQATFSGRVALRNWSYEPSSPMRVTLNAQRLRITELLQLARQQYPVAGDLSAKVSLSGTQVDPQGSGTVEIANAQAYGEPLQQLAMQFQAAKGEVTSTLRVASSAGAVSADLSFVPKTKAYKVSLNAPSIVIAKLKTVQARNMGLTGTVSASVRGQGTVDDPQLNAVVRLPELKVRDKSISGIKADLQVAQHAANFTFDTQVSQASIRAHGRVALVGNYETDASVDTSAIPLEVLMATYASGAPQGFAGQTELHATLKGPLKDKSRVEAHLSIPVLKASYQSLQIGIVRPIKADYQNSVITLQPSELEGTGTSLRFQGRIPVGGNEAPAVTAQGSIDAQLLRIVSPDLRSSGVVALDVRSSGSASNPDVQGQVQFKNIALTTEAAPVGVENLNGTMDITKDHLKITNMTGMVGGGQVSLGGSVSYRPAVQFNLAVQGKSVRLRYPEGLRSVLDANLAFTGTQQASTLNGRVLIDSLSFTPDFDLSKFGDQFSTGATTPTQPGFADNVKLQIGVQSQESLSATSSQVSIAGRVALQVVGTAANPVITGRTNFTSGELFFRNVRYKLDKGVITFDNPNETHPVLNVSIGTTIEQYNLTLEMRGPLDKLTTQYVSDPPLATADIINLIARGKTTQESAASSQSTDSMIASQAASQLSSSVQKLAGLSSLQIDPTLGGNGQNPSARVALQQRVTKNLLFTFSTDVSQPGSEIVQGEYQINKRWSVSLERDQLGGVSVDGRYHKRF